MTRRRPSDSEGRKAPSRPTGGRGLAEIRGRQDERRCCHSPPATGTTNAPRFTRIGYQTIQAAVPAVDTKKASILNTAIEELPKFVFNEAGDGTVALPLTGQEGLQMAGDDYIHGIVFRISGPVLGIDGHAGIAECTPRRIASNN